MHLTRTFGHFSKKKILSSLVGSLEGTVKVLFKLAYSKWFKIDRENGPFGDDTRSPRVKKIRKTNLFGVTLESFLE